ncbi:Short-chain dehydrogenase/reductase SDR [Penicillium cf. griseofulvum]|uniref:Short-chain dehydrogenase/reductase SDR n=1 Tax=Penicillium cf. griseofulvum TaxID=2972120 RepID=A0A9W9T2F9_9EURO|nr:Short-chain dehydrogenase/reductase SDR [Penicillium cf. griseofulvum]KAJ5448214.1 Short-chain dehydrogenase/reductase SDR [Penicillium cf. griseofulvum]
MSKIALITGGSLAVAKDLSQTGDWQVNIIGSNQERGQTAASLSSLTFYQADVRNYQQLATVFEQIFNAAGRIDFVFANAGTADYTDFFAQCKAGIPPDPGSELVDINVNGALFTSYLAMHYFRRSPEVTKGHRNLILTSSIGGLYPSMLTPVYSSTKHALIGFTRSVGERLWEEGVRVNALCPGVVETPLFAVEAFVSIFPREIFIPMDVVTGVVSQLLSGADMVDAKGMCVTGDEMHSRAIHISGETFFFIEKPEIYDEQSRITWAAMMGHN